MVGAIVPVEGNPPNGGGLQRVGRQRVLGPGRQPGGQRHQRHGAQPRGGVSHHRQHRRHRRRRPDPHGSCARHDGLGQRGRLRRQHSSPASATSFPSALSQGYFLSDDPYASPDPLGVGGQTLYTPSLAIGRLVETPTQIDNALSRFQKSNGQLNATSALSTGYDFVTQAANAVCGVAERSARCRQRQEFDQRLVDHVGPPECRRRRDSDQPGQCAGHRLVQRALRLQPPVVGRR